jgi:hypothetical protein
VFTLHLAAPVYNSECFCTAGMCLVSADTLVPAAPEDTIPITGYPEGSWINYSSWSPDGTYITFTTRSPGRRFWGQCGSGPLQTQ